MPNIVLYGGQPDPNKIKLKPHKKINVNLTGVIASAAIGVGLWAVGVNGSGVAASPAIGSPSTKVTLQLSGVTANAQIGTGTIREDVVVTSSGVAASPAIGVGTFNSNFAISGVAAGSTVGTAQLNVSFTLSGAAADAQIGDGIVDTGQPGQVIVNLTGVAADPQIGTGTVEIQSVITYPRPIAEGWPRQRLTHVKPDKYVFIPPRPIFVESDGVRAYPNVRNASKIRVNAKLPVQPFPVMFYSPNGTIDTSFTIAGEYAEPSIGTGEVKRVIDLTEEEIITLMEAA